MEILLCGGGIFVIVMLVIFFYLLNTARKKVPSAGAFGKKNYAPVYISLADKPMSILQGMNRLKTEVQRTETAGDKWRWIPMLIFFAGIGLALIDVLLLLLGYFSLIFSAGGLALWVAAIVMARGIRRSDSLDFSPRYESLKHILYTLRDDLRPGSTFLGHLDLTGSMLPTKVARSAKDTQNRTTNYYRDEWLALKAKLYDGNVLRVSAVQKSKKRASYTKRSRISGKYKVKPEKFKGSAQDLKVRIVVNPELYQIGSRPTLHHGQNVGKYTITEFSTEGGIIDLTASSPYEEVEHEHILNVIHSAYSLLERKAA